jgi:hypothetical protein
MARTRELARIVVTRSIVDRAKNGQALRSREHFGFAGYFDNPQNPCRLMKVVRRAI